MQIVSMLRNQVTGRYHPILFYYAPPPSGDLDSGARRYRSKGHHTAGLGTRDEALVAAQALAQQTGAVPSLDSDIAWDGEGVPAMTLWFGAQEGLLRPMV